MRFCSEKNVGCSVCGLVFLDEDHYDGHRVRPIPRGPFRCMTASELQAANFIRTRKGLWAQTTRGAPPYCKKRK